MSSKQKLAATVMIILTAVFAFGVFGTWAQGNPPPTPVPGTNGYGMMGGSTSGEVFTAVAGALGIDAATLSSELQSGKTFTQIATERKVELQTVYDAALGVMAQHMTTMVTAGYMTQAQVDNQLAWMRANIAQMPMFTGAGFGYGCCSMDEWMGHGMMGHDMMGWGMWGQQGNNLGQNPGMMGPNGWHHDGNMGGMMGPNGWGDHGGGMMGWGHGD